MFKVLQESFKNETIILIKFIKYEKYINHFFYA
jgi:hypothetical protein